MGESGGEEVGQSHSSTIMGEAWEGERLETGRAIKKFLHIGGK